MKKTFLIIFFIFIFTFSVLIIFSMYDFNFYEQFDETADVSLNFIDLSGGTTTLQYEPEESVVFNDNIRYNPDNFDLTYHDLNKYASLYETNLKNIQVWDSSKNSLVNLPYAPTQTLPVYYDIDKKRYGSFHPTYEDSVLLSHYR